MATRYKFALVCVLAVLLGIPAGFFVFLSGIHRRGGRDSAAGEKQLVEAFQIEVARAETRYHSPVETRSRHEFSPLSSLRDLGSRGCEDDALSSLILQNALIKKDRRLAYQQLDIDKCNALIFAYVKRCVSENKNYLLRRKLVESFGQTNRAVLINRMRLVAVLLGGEKGRGGMEPQFTPIREEAHRFSPYVLVLISGYIEKLEQEKGANNRVPMNFKIFVDSLGTDLQSERAIASIGARNRGAPANSLYALRVLHRDLSVYYGERVEPENDATPHETILWDAGSFQSETLDDLRRRNHAMGPLELAMGFIALGAELREHLSLLRDGRDAGARVDDEEVNQLKKLNEIVATVAGLFASGRLGMDPVRQAETLADILYLEGLYSKKQRKSIRKELSAVADGDSGDEKRARAFHTFLSYMHGLAYARMDEALGGAARAYSTITKEADNYMEVQARKSSLQTLGLLQLEYYEQRRGMLAGKKDVHIGGSARGKLTVFRSKNDIDSYLRNDPTNGADTIWVIKSGLNMPNQASFAAIILEDPIMKASHYDGYARSRKPPLPLLQVPNATELYARYHGQTVLLEASAGPGAEISLKALDSAEAPPRPRAAGKLRLKRPPEDPRLFAIDGVKSNEEIREWQKRVGSKAANYAFLRSGLPLDKATGEEHIYPGFAIPFHYYQRHVVKSGAEKFIARLENITEAESVRPSLQAIRDRILNEPVEPALMNLIRGQLENGLRTQHRNQEGTVKLRFRSSSNAEDNRDFSGAGLYESHFAFYTYESGFSRAAMISKINGDNSRNIAAAISMVWASLWKAEAYLAREAAGIAQETVRMGVLAHPSYRGEESTGVVYYYAPNDIEIFVHKGNENVQNPEVAGLTPEVHRISDAAHKIEHSSRYVISENVILSPKDRSKLLALLDQIVPKFTGLYRDQDVTAVDVEFKVLEASKSDGGKKDTVYLKQIRPLAKRQLPAHDAAPPAP